MDIAAVVWPNGQADIFRVASDNCNVYRSHSTNGQTWGAWNWFGSCGDQIAVAVMPDSTAWAMLRTPLTATESVVVHQYFNGTSWAGTWSYFPNPQLPVNDIDLLAYSPPVCCAKLTLWTVGSNNSSIYYRNWNGSAWSAWTLWTTGYKRVSSFSTSDGGAYLLFLGTNNNNLYTEHFTGTAWAGIMPQGGSRTWLATAGVNIDDETGNAYEHTEYNDDCRTQPYTNGPVCNSDGYCFWTQGVNLAEIIYNEARGETVGAQDLVAWTVRDRAFQGLRMVLNSLGQLVSCDAYPGGNKVCATPCNQQEFCGPPNNTQRYCCAMHGGQTQWGTSGYQFNDKHVDIDDLSSSLIIWEAAFVGNGWVGDPSTSWCPPGVVGCSFACGDPGSFDGSNFNDPSPAGPMEFRSSDYCAAVSAGTLSECKWYAGDFCGNTPSPPANPIQVPPFGACATTGATNDNFFWNRVPPSQALSQ